MLNVKHTAPRAPLSDREDQGTIEWIHKWWAKEQLGISSMEDFSAFMEPAGDYENPISGLPGYAAAKELFAGIAPNSRVLIFGDYDADGLTSSSILKLFLVLTLDVECVDVFIPDRYRHGYGASDAGIRSALAGGDYDHIILVDNGSGSLTQVEKMRKETPAKILIIDHHEPDFGDFPVEAHLNPKLHSCDAAVKLHECSAAGLAYLLAKQLAHDLSRDESFLDGMLGMIASIGTVADVMNLRGVNRSILANAMAYSETEAFTEELPALYALLLELGCTGFDEKSIGWSIAPAINSLSRLGRSTGFALDLFIGSTRSPEDVAEALAQANADRKEKSEEAMDELFMQDSPYPTFEPRNAHLVVSGMVEGLIGIAAARLCYSTNLPAFVGSIRGDVVKFSGRTPDDRVSLSSVVKEAHNRGLLISGGGHHQACGFSILLSKLEEFADLLDEIVPRGDNNREFTVIGDLNWFQRPTVWIDVIESLRPFGGPDVQRPCVNAPNVTVLTHPAPINRRSDGKPWAMRFHVGETGGRGIEVTATDLEMCAGIKRGQKLNAILQPEVTEKIAGVYTNWYLVEAEAVCEETVSTSE
jgi:single-stranded-DNA-specific exonuclease